MKSVALLTLSIVTLFSASLSQASLPFNEKACMNKANSNVDMKQCSYLALQDADKRLNALYSQIKKTLSADKTADGEETLKRLLTSERAWISYRDAECSLQGAEMLGGSGEGLVNTECVGELTRAKTKDLLQMKSFLE